MRTLISVVVVLALAGCASNGPGWPANSAAWPNAQDYANSLAMCEKLTVPERVPVCAKETGLVVERDRSVYGQNFYEKAMGICEDEADMGRRARCVVDTSNELRAAVNARRSPMADAAAAYGAMLGSQAPTGLSARSGSITYGRIPMALPRDPEWTCTPTGIMGQMRCTQD